MSNAYRVSGLVRKRADQLRAGIARLDAVPAMMEPVRPEQPRSRQRRPGVVRQPRAAGAGGPAGCARADDLDAGGAVAAMGLGGLEATDRAMPGVAERRVAASPDRRIGPVGKVPRRPGGVRGGSRQTTRIVNLWRVIFLLVPAAAPIQTRWCRHAGG